MAKKRFLSTIVVAGVAFSLFFGTFSHHNAYANRPNKEDVYSGTYYSSSNSNTRNHTSTNKNKNNNEEKDNVDTFLISTAVKTAVKAYIAHKFLQFSDSTSYTNTNEFKSNITKGIDLAKDTANKLYNKDFTGAARSLTQNTDVLDSICTTFYVWPAVSIASSIIDGGIGLLLGPSSNFASFIFKLAVTAYTSFSITGIPFSRTLGPKILDASIEGVEKLNKLKEELFTKEQPEIKN